MDRTTLKQHQSKDNVMANILAVDDSVAIRCAIGEILKQQGHQVQLRAPLLIDYALCVT